MSDGTSDASLYCTLCAVRCLNASSWASHLSGKKHKRNLSRSLPADSRSAGDVPNQSGPGVLVSAACPDQQATTFVTNQVARFLVHEIPKLWAGPNVATGVLVRVSQDSLDQVRALNPLVRPADHPILTYTVAEVFKAVSLPTGVTLNLLEPAQREKGLSLDAVYLVCGSMNPNYQAGYVMHRTGSILGTLGKDISKPTVGMPCRLKATLTMAKIGDWGIIKEVRGSGNYLHLRVWWIKPFQELDRRTEAYVDANLIDYYLVEPNCEVMNDAGDSMHYLHWLHRCGLTVRIHGWAPYISPTLCVTLFSD